MRSKKHCKSGVYIKSSSFNEIKQNLRNEILAHYSIHQFAAFVNSKKYNRN